MINEKLEDNIRVFAMRSATKNFDIKINVRSRVYEYILPFRCLYPMDPKLGDVPFNPEMTTEKNDEIFKKFSKLIKKFEGTNNFHNYTVAAKCGDKSSIRYILSMNAERIPSSEIKQTLGLWDEEPKDMYIKVTLHGQSFIYHQIRKMIGMIVAIFQKEDGDGWLIDNSFVANKIPVWLAPSEGLMLDELRFDAYNRKNNIPETLELTEEERSAIADFKKNILYKEIFETSEKENVFEHFLKENLLGGQYCAKKRIEKREQAQKEEEEKKL